MTERNGIHGCYDDPEQVTADDRAAAKLVVLCGIATALGGLVLALAIGALLSGCGWLDTLTSPNVDNGSVGGDGAVVVVNPPGCGTCSGAGSSATPTPAAIGSLTVERASCTAADHCSAFRAVWTGGGSYVVSYASADGAVSGSSGAAVPSGTVVDPESSGPPRTYTVTVGGLSASVSLDS